MGDASSDFVQKRVTDKTSRNQLFTKSIIGAVNDVPFVSYQFGFVQCFGLFYFRFALSENLYYITKKYKNDV